jgi:CubicO group peptidase (beta-lactamase class C family)
VLLPAGIKRPAIIAQDRFGFGNSDAGVRLFAEDWIRFAVWVNQKQKSEGCLGDYVREASKTQIQVKTRPTAHGGYGYLIWTEDKLAPHTYWATGYAGQRLAWNPKNNRMLVVFSNDARAMDQVSTLYRDWSALDIAKP